MTTQSRFWVSTHRDFPAAHKAKDDFKNDNPDAVIQIRKGWSKGREVFRLVERFKLNEVKTIVNEKKKAKRKNHGNDLSRA